MQVHFIFYRMCQNSASIHISLEERIIEGDDLEEKKKFLESKALRIFTAFIH